MNRVSDRDLLDLIARDSLADFDRKTRKFLDVVAAKLRAPDVVLTASERSRVHSLARRLGAVLPDEQDSAEVAEAVSIEWAPGDVPEPAGEIGYHPLANLFPLITGPEFDELVRDVRENGLREPILLDKALDKGGQIVDGRNRYRATLEAKQSFVFEVAPPGANLLRLVISRNLRRRHLNESQRARIAAKLANMTVGRPPIVESLKASSAERIDTGPIGPISNAEAAEIMSVGERTVKRAKFVDNRGSPELKAAFERDEIRLEAAAEIAKLPVDQQREVIQRIVASPSGRKIVREVAKKVRAEQQSVRHGERQQALEEIAERNPELPAGRKFSFVYIDVPRKPIAYSDDTGQEKAPAYPTMDFDGLCDFAIDAFAAPNCILAFWTTAASIVDDVEVLADWGFVSLRPRGTDGRILKGEDGRRLGPIGGGRYGSLLVWRKQRVGKATGMGRWFRDQAEFLIFARRGNDLPPAPLPGTQIDSVLDAPIGDHSAKPAEIRAWIDQIWPSLSKIEIFARGHAPLGWTYWGNQSADPKEVAAP